MQIYFRLANKKKRDTDKLSLFLQTNYFIMSKYRAKLFPFYQYSCQDFTFSKYFLSKCSATQFEILNLMSGAKGEGLVNGTDGKAKFSINGKEMYSRILIKKVSA